MPQTERKQVLGVGDAISSLRSPTDAATPALADGSLHGLAGNLTEEGDGFVTVPANTSVPTIDGTEQVGEVLTVTPGVWDEGNAPTTYAYQWKNAGVAITDATDLTYELQATDEGDLITVTETATNEEGSVSATSAATGAIAAA